MTESANAHGHKTKSSVKRRKKTSVGHAPRTVKDTAVAYLMEIIEVSENGAPKRMTVFQAIVSQLFIKAFAGDSKARRVLEKYAEYARRHDPRSGFLIIVSDDAP